MNNNNLISKTIMSIFLLIFLMNYFLLFDFRIINGIFYITACIFIIMTIVRLSNVIYNIIIKNIIFLLFVLIFMIFHMILFKNLNLIFISNLPRVIFICIPLFLFGKELNSCRMIYNLNEKIVSLILKMCICFEIVNIFVGIRIEGYSMGISYSILFFLGIYLSKIKYSYKECVKIFYFIWFILKYGSRGSLLCILVYIVCLEVNNFIYKRELVKNILLLLCVVMIFYTKKQVFSFLQIIVNIFNISSRSIDLLIRNSGNGVYLSGRNILYSNIINIIKNNPLQIRGIFSERLINSGIYAHNIVLELLYQFGIVIGGLLIILIAILFFRIVFSNRQYLFNRVTFSLGIISLTRLMISSDVWINLEFWLWLGLCFNRNLNRNRKRNDKNDNI